MQEQENARARIEELEKEKDAFIERIKALNRRLTYKKYEKKALEPFLEQTKHVRTEGMRRVKKAVEFKIATQAYTPQIEKEFIKELRKIEVELAKVSEIDRARRKSMLVSRDIEDAQKEIEGIEPKLKDLREQLKKLYGEATEARTHARKEATVKSFKEEMPTMEDMGVIEIKKKN